MPCPRLWPDQIHLLRIPAILRSRLHSLHRSIIHKSALLRLHTAQSQYDNALCITPMCYGYKAANICYHPCYPALCRHVSSTSTREGFSSAAATRSLSLSCLLTMGACMMFSYCHNHLDILKSHWPACSLWWEPGLTLISTLKRAGNARSRRTRIDSPMRVDMPQWGTVGVNSTSTRPGATVIWGAETTASCSNVIERCSGSLMERIRS